jgi:plasmid stability protein
VQVDFWMDRWQYGNMAKVKTTLSLDEELMRYIRVRAARTGKTQSHVLEEALRKGLGAIERIRSKNEADEEEALVLASKALHDVRSEGRKR